MPVTDATVLPLRNLGPDEELAIRRFYARSGVGLFLALYLPVVLGMSLGGAFWGVWQGLALGVGVAALWVLLRWLSGRRAIAAAEYVYQYGNEEELVFNGITDNYSYKVNGAPQQIISLLRNGHPEQVKTFSNTVRAVYSVPRQVVYTHPKHPGVMVPSALFQLQWDVAPRTVGRTLRRALVFVVPFLFVFGLMFFINGEMGSHSSTYAQPDALVYRNGGHLVLATVTTRFQAYEVSNKGTYGTDNCYAAGLDIATGKQLWKVPFTGKDNNGHGPTSGRLLGQSARYLFFIANGLCIIDKTTGRQVTDNAGLKALGSVLSKAQVMSYTDDANYTYNDSLQAVVAQGTDGLFYTIDGNTLKTGSADVADPDAYFKNHYRFGNNYEDQIAALYDDGRHCLALLDAKDTTLLAHNAYGVQERPAAQSVRRMLYSCSAMRLDDSWKALNGTAFLFGGFLVDAAVPYRKPVDTVAQYASYQSLLVRYNTVNEPMQLPGDGLIIMHKSSIETDATLLLTGIGANGAARWQVSTGYGSIPFMYHDAAGNMLYLGGNAKGGMSDRLTELQAIDLVSGAVRKYRVN